MRVGGGGWGMENEDQPIKEASVNMGGGGRVEGLGGGGAR